MGNERPRTLMRTEVGLVLGVESERPGAQELSVKVNYAEERAVNYTQLLGEVARGEQVMLNTTAVRAKLGTGGYHFVMKRAGQEKLPNLPPGRQAGEVTTEAIL